MKAAVDSQGTRRGKMPAYVLALEDKLAGYMNVEQIERVRRAYELGAVRIARGPGSRGTRVAAVTRSGLQ